MKLGLLLSLVSFSAFGNMSYLKSFKTTYPDSKSNKCTTCHSSGKNLNEYGIDFQKGNYDFKSIEELDSDGDKVINIDEIKNGTNPGDASSLTTFELAQWIRN